MKSNTNRKRVKVHMLPKPQYFYFTTDEEIKDNDHFMSAYYGYPLQNTKEWREQQKKQSGKYPDLSDLKHHKIIASTDPKLTCMVTQLKELGHCSPNKLLPQPSQAFIKKYCKAGGIYEVDVEYKYGFSLKLRRRGESHAYKLKVDSHNTITIHPIKDNWSKEEVIAACKEAFSYGVRLWEDWEEEDWKMWDSFVKENF